MSLVDKTSGKEWAIFKLILLIAFVFLLYKLLSKFGLLGMSDEEKNAQALGESTALNDEVNKNTKLGKAIQKQIGKKVVTPQDVKDLTPNRANFGKWIQEIWDAKGTFKDNEDTVYKIMRQMNSQFEINLFSKTFAVVKGRDLFGFLATFLNDEQLSNVHTIIKNKKLV
jgi:hypothetical protein